MIYLFSIYSYYLVKCYFLLSLTVATIILLNKTKNAACWTVKLFRPEDNRKRKTCTSCYHGNESVSALISGCGAAPL